MTVGVTVSCTRTKDIGNKLVATQEDLKQMAIGVRSKILVNTKSGYDLLDNRFAKYSKGYAKKRERMKKRTDIVNLEYEGVMLQSMNIKTYPGQALLYFADAHRRKIALKHNTGEGKMPMRVFFGLTQTMADKFFLKLAKTIKARLK